MAKRHVGRNEERYGVTHAFELETAKTLGCFAEQLRQHTEQIGGINVSFSSMNLGFAKMELDIHEIKEAIKDLHDPSVSVRHLFKWGATIFTAILGSAFFWDIIRGWLGL